MTTLLTPIAALGRLTLQGLAAMGRIALFAAEVISHLFRPPFYPKEFAQALLS